MTKQRRLQRNFFALAATVLFGFGAAQAHATPTSSFTATKTCGAGYVHANLSWGVKCLRAGEFCKVGNSEYHRYGYTCSGSGHLTYYTGGTSKPKPRSAPSHPAGATALCNDGTYSYSAQHSGSCSHHGGVAVFYT